MNYNNIFIFLLFLLFLFPVRISAQQHSHSVINPKLPDVKNPSIPTPRYNSPFNNSNNPYQSQTSGHTNLHVPDDSQQRNAALIREIEEYQAYINRQKTQKEKDADYLTKNGFPFQGNNPTLTGTEHYYTAFDTINQMLSGKIPLHLGKAIFLVENAYYENKLNYSDYEKALKEKVNFCHMLMKEEKIDTSKCMAKNMVLFRLITDTIKVKLKGTERTYISYPIKYDYKDFKSEKSYDSHFVTKLMRTNEGQCNSMPLYYLALAEQLGAEAYWAFSPWHSFIRIKDNKGNWYNLELTNGYIMSDAHYINNSYIKAEALQNKIYMTPMDKKQTIAELLNNLALGYINKYGYDNFVLQCAKTSKQHSDRDLNALMIEADYYTRLTLTIARLLEAKQPEILKEKSPQAYKYYEKMLELYEQIDNTGFEELPVPLYEKWLEYIANEKEKAKSNNRLLQNSIIGK